VSWAFTRIGVHRPSQASLRFPNLVFSIRSYLPLDFNRVSSLQPTYRHPFGRPFTYSLLCEFPGLGLALVPDVVVPEADSGAHGVENSIQISALAGVEPRTWASSRGLYLYIYIYPSFDTAASILKFQKSNALILM